jgi:hypothetical protein
MGVQGVEGLQACGLQRFFVAFEAFAGGIEVADVTDEGDALVAVVDEVFRRLPRALAVLDQHRVGADALRGPVEGTTGSPAACSASRWLSCPRAGTIRSPSTWRCVRSPT